jgi:hypothetical protein
VKDTSRNGQLPKSQLEPFGLFMFGLTFWKLTISPNIIAKQPRQLTNTLLIAVKCS